MITVKRAISDTKRWCAVERVTIIKGTEVLFSGQYNRLFSDCDPDMLLYRDSLLRKEILDKYLFNHRELFIFLKEAAA